MQCRGGQYSEARFSCTAQMIRNKQKHFKCIKNYLWSEKHLRINPRNTNIGGKNKRGMHSVSSSNVCYSESVFKADS